MKDLTEIEEIFVRMLLEEKYIYSIRSISNEGDIEKKKFFFIGYGLDNPQFSDYCLDYVEMIDWILYNLDREKDQEAVNERLFGVRSDKKLFGID